MAKTLQHAELGRWNASAEVPRQEHAEQVPDQKGGGGGGAGGNGSEKSGRAASDPSPTPSEAPRTAAAPLHLMSHPAVDSPSPSPSGWPRSSPLISALRCLRLPGLWSFCGPRRAPVLPLQRRGRGCGPRLHHPECALLLLHLALLWAVSPLDTPLGCSLRVPESPLNMVLGPRVEPIL